MVLKVKKIVITMSGIFSVTLFFWFDLQHYLTLEALKAKRQLLLEYNVSHRIATAVWFIIAYIIQTTLALPGAAILSLAAGAIFGAVLGTIYAVAAATAGATLAFLTARYLLRDAVQKRFGPKLEVLNRELESRGFSYLLFLRLVPVFPFFLINLSSGLTRLSLKTFILGTLIGIIPGGFIYVNAGASLAAINSISDVMSMTVLGSLSLLGLLALLPTLYGKFTKRG